MVCLSSKESEELIHDREGSKPSQINPLCYILCLNQDAHFSDPQRFRLVIQCKYFSKLNAIVLKMNYFPKGELFHRRRTNLGLACVPQRQPLMLPPSPLCHQQLCFSGLVSPHQDQNNLGAIYPPNPSPGRLKDSRRILPSLPNAAQRLLSLQPKCLLIHLQEAREHDVMDLNMAFGWMQGVVGWDI